jgi:hypothetical protein
VCESYPNWIQVTTVFRPITLVLVVLATSCVSSSSADPQQAVEEFSHSLYTHCGIEYAEIDGRFWLADVDDVPLLPLETQMEWDDPMDHGTMTILSGGSAVYRGDKGLLMRFTPAPAQYVPPGCY